MCHPFAPLIRTIFSVAAPDPDTFSTCTGGGVYVPSPSSTQVFEAFPRNRLSKFQYFPGDATATRDSEEILLTTIPKASGIHSAGWVDFKPSDFTQVRMSTREALTREFFFEPARCCCSS